MSFTNFIFLSRIKIDVVPEAFKHIDLTERAAKRQRQKGERLLYGSTEQLVGDFKQVMNKFLGPMMLWANAIKSINKIMGGLIQLKTQEKVVVSPMRQIFRHVTALPFRWAILARNKMAWSIKKKQLYGTILSFGSHIKAGIIFVIKLLRNLFVAFKGIINIIKGIATSVIGFLTRYLGKVGSALVIATLTFATAKLALDEVLGIHDETIKEYQEITTLTETGVQARQKDIVEDFEKTGAAFFKISDVSNEEQVKLYVDSSKQFDDFLGKWEIVLGEAVPFTLDSSIFSYAYEIAGQFTQLLAFIFGDARTDLGQGSVVIIPSSDLARALLPLKTVENWITRAEAIYGATRDIHSIISTEIINLKKHLMELIMKADDDTPKELMAIWNRALGILEQAPLAAFFQGVFIPATKIEDITKVQQLQTSLVNEMKKGLTTEQSVQFNNIFQGSLISSAQTGGMMGQAQVKSPELMDKRARRRRNLRITVDGELEVDSIDNFNLSNISNKLSQYIEEEVKREWV